MAVYEPGSGLFPDVTKSGAALFLNFPASSTFAAQATLWTVFPLQQPRGTETGLLINLIVAVISRVIKVNASNTHRMHTVYRMSTIMQSLRKAATSQCLGSVER